MVEFRKRLALLTSILEALLCKVDIKRHSLSWQATRCQPAFSEPCLVNLISKDTHPVFSISRQASLCQALPGKLDIKDTHLVFSISRQASLCQQAFSKPCLVNLISKDNHLVFSISRQASLCQQALHSLAWYT